jgi:hypothetical protein
LHPNHLKLPMADAPLIPQRIGTPRHRHGEKFLKGPIPLNWLSVAAKQSGKALHVATAIWFWAGLRRSREVALSMSWLRTNFGVNRYSGYRGLVALERIGLVSVVRHPGRKPLVTLLEAPAAPPTRDEVPKVVFVR